jgi:hypothetical protein
VRTPAYDALSTEYLFYHARQRAPQFDPTRGATVPEIVESLALDGQPVEVMWPYLPELPLDLKTYLPPTGLTPVFRRSATVLPGTFAALEGELRAGRAAMIVFEATENFMYAQDGTPISISPSDRPTGLHAVVAVGLGTANTTRCIRVKNSWGTGWGDGGYGWLTEGYFTAHAISVVGMV